MSKKETTKFIVQLIASRICNPDSTGSHVVYGPVSENILDQIGRGFLFQNKQIMSCFPFRIAVANI